MQPFDGIGKPTPSRPRFTVRPAVPADAAAIGAVFDAAVRAGWTYLGELVVEPMFAPQDWDELVADHLPPNLLLVAVDEADGVVGYVAAHPEDGELFRRHSPARAASRQAALVRSEGAGAGAMMV